MGARASRRRHEGRRIRKAHRGTGPQLEDFGKVADAAATALSLFGEAFSRVGEAIKTIQATYEVIDLGIPGLIAVRDRRDGTVTVGVDPALPYPTQSGVEALRSAATASAEMRGFEIDVSTIIVDEIADFPLCAPESGCQLCYPTINLG